jgi:hypothetical protein
MTFILLYLIFSNNVAIYSSDSQKEDEEQPSQPHSMLNFTEMIEMGENYSDDDSSFPEEFVQILKRRRQLDIQNEFSIM